jgi:hypothetical protein
MKEIFGCFVSVATNAKLDKVGQEAAFEKGRLFRKYIWNENGINNILKGFDCKNYGNDVEMILFEFYINPIMEQFKYIAKGFTFKKKQKAIGIPIVITDDNFFNKPENIKIQIIKETIVEKMILLFEYIKNKKINIQLDILINELKNKLYE